MGVTTEYRTFSKLPPKRILDRCGDVQVSKSLLDMWIQIILDPSQKYHIIQCIFIDPTCRIWIQVILDTSQKIYDDMTLIKDPTWIWMDTSHF